MSYENKYIKRWINKQTHEGWGWRGYGLNYKMRDTILGKQRSLEPGTEIPSNNQAFEWWQVPQKIFSMEDNKTLTQEQLFIIIWKFSLALDFLPPQNLIWACVCVVSLEKWPWGSRKGNLEEGIREGEESKHVSNRAGWGCRHLELSFAEDPQENSIECILEFSPER